VTWLLIEISASLRAMGDQIFKVQDNDIGKKEYYARLAEIKNFDFALFA
jgi:hypothetical protein